MMNKTIFSLAAASVALAAPQVIAQEADGTEMDMETLDETSGAIVTREEIVEDVLDEDGNPVPALGEDGEPVLDDDGNPVFETAVVGFTQTVETPSGITHTVTKVDGSPAVVTHQNLGAPEVAAAARENAVAAASNARQTAEAARENAAGAREQAQQARVAAQDARDAAKNARDNARNIPRPGRPG